MSSMLVISQQSPPCAALVSIQKGSRVLFSLWDSLLSGRVPKNTAGTLAVGDALTSLSPRCWRWLLVLVAGAGTLAVGEVIMPLDWRESDEDGSTRVMFELRGEYAWVRPASSAIRRGAGPAGGMQ